jgi:hypothetical protein
MFQAEMTTPARAYQVRIRDEYLEDLYQFDAGSVEQEVFARSERGLIIVMTDRPEMIFQKLGEAVHSVTYLGPMVDLPEQPVYANHSAVSRTCLVRETEDEAFIDDLRPDDRPIHVRALGLTARAGHLIVQPFIHFTSLVARKILPNRALSATHIGEES